MAPLCGFCGEHVNTLRQQVSVMRKEIKNLRQMLDSAVRANRKHMLSIQSAVTKTGVCPPATGKLPSPASTHAALEQGIIQTVPVGYIGSCFSVKNGTPRQPTVCGPSRAELRIRQSVFNNPEHALIGLEQYSHVWIIFLFHKNGHLSYKAKVKPPRLNGQRVGVYSTRSPHRPNALGQTLAKLDKIVGDTLHLSDIDMIAGTPVLDIKPYIPEYDSPHTRTTMDFETLQADQPKVTPPPSPGETIDMTNPLCDPETNVQPSQSCEKTEDDYRNFEVDAPDTDSLKDAFQLFEPLNALEEVKAYIAQNNLEALNSESNGGVSDVPQTKPTDLTVEQLHYGEEAYSTIADWIREPPVSTLEVRFTPHAQKELAEFLPTQLPGPPQSHRPRFKFLRSSEEAAAAIKGVLSADPRSVYRRTRCKDRLFFFTLDTADITCWFGQGFAEVLQVRPVDSYKASV